MPPSSRSSVIDETPGQSNGQKYVDVDVLRNADRLVAIFSQCRWDGRITFAIHREYDRYNPDAGDGKFDVLKTSFVPESLAASYAAMCGLALENLEKLKQKRSEGGLPFPEGGLEVRRRSR
jgi:hypothetical protein